MLLMELTGNTPSVTSQMQFYINFLLCFFSGISDHDSVKLCYSRSQVFFFIRCGCLGTKEVSVNSWVHVTLVWFTAGPDVILVFVKPAMKPQPGSLWGGNLKF